MFVKVLSYSLFTWLAFTGSLLKAADFTIGMHPDFKLPGISKKVAKKQTKKAIEEISRSVNVNFKYSPTPEILITSKRYDGTIAGWWSGKRVIMNEHESIEWTEDKVYYIMVHEILHALKLEHDEDELSMMKATPSGVMHLGPTDLINLIERYGLRKE
jgi:hypothetical protein